MQTGQDDLSSAGRNIKHPTQEIKTPQKRRLWWLWYLLGLSALSALGLLAFVWWACRDLPDLSKIQNYQPWGITRIFDRDGHVVAEFADQRRTPILYKEMPRHLVDAIVAAEDADFFKHKGLDYLGILRAFWKNLWRKRGAPKQGGSTITQQVVKTFLLTPDQFYTRKIREAVLARQLEQNLKKEEILYLYLNQIDFGRNCHGVEEAARYYFGKSARQLNLSESAILAGIPKNPERYNPARSIRLTRRRRRYVLRMLLRNNKIDLETFDKTNSSEILPPPPPKAPPLQEDYYTDEVRRRALQRLQAKLVDTIKDPETRKQRARDLFYRGALRIETPLDTKLQQRTQRLLTQHLQHLRPTAKSKFFFEDKNTPTTAPKKPILEIKPTLPEKSDSPYKPPLQGAVILLEPHTRLVRALVGGRDFRTAPFNRATQARRPPGSAFKPILYTAAIESRQYTAASLVNDAYFAVIRDGKRWVPQNNSRRYSNQQVRLREALAQSLNTVAVRVIDALTPNRVIETAQRLGIQAPLEPRLPLALGASAVQPLALTNAYATFAAQGVFDDPAMIERILDAQGKTIFQRLPNPRGVISPAVAYIMTSMLEDVVKIGTARAALQLKRPIAGKTGTTNQNRDAWFIGYTPQMCAGIWIGFDKRHTIGDFGTGSRAALPLFIKMFSTPPLQQEPIQPFPVSEDLLFANIDPKSGNLAQPHRPFLREAFLPGTQPRRYASFGNVLNPDDFFRNP
ncbi:MAG: PBP1A family penicillin-binding protein [Myxococcales bacterium]|nr:PBP1A family penicillin-binding protein [Myxococcales bacterium]